MARKKWGCARVEFLTVWPEVNDQLKRGRSLKTIYDELREANRITMSKTAFYENRAAMTHEPAPRKPISGPEPSQTQSRATVSQQPTPPSGAFTSHMPTVTQLPAAAATDFWDGDLTDTETADTRADGTEPAGGDDARPDLDDDTP